MAKRDKAVVLYCERQAVGLRLAEKSYEQISESVMLPSIEGQEPKRAYSNAGAAQKAVIRALKRDVTTDAGDLKLKAIGQINKGMEAIFPDVLRGKLGAIDRMINLQRQLATLVDELAVPEKHEHTGPGGAPFIVEMALPAKGSTDGYPFPADDPS